MIDTYSLLVGGAIGAIAFKLLSKEETPPAQAARPVWKGRNMTASPVAMSQNFEGLDRQLLSQLRGYAVDGLVFAEPGQPAPRFRGSQTGARLYLSRTGRRSVPNHVFSILAFGYDPIGNSGDPGVLLNLPSGILYLRTNDDAAVSLFNQFIENRIRWADSLSGR